MNNKVDPKDFENYLKEARTWETDKVQEMEKSQKIAWRVATASGTVAFASVMAVAMLTPLKTVEPYVIRVDNSTGIVDVVESLRDGETNYDEAINKYFTQWYVRYREGYSKELAEDYYSYVGILSAGPEQLKYYDFFNPKNKLSPLTVYGEYAKVKIRIKSTSLINPNVALVRYVKDVMRGSDKPESSHWAATITFKYSNAPMKEKDRAINPLGFQVTEYRNDPDAFTTDTTSTPPASAPTTAASMTTGVTVFPGQTPAVPALLAPMGQR